MTHQTWFRIRVVEKGVAFKSHAVSEVERLAKLPFSSTSDEKHLEQLKQVNVGWKLVRFRFWFSVCSEGRWKFQVFIIYFLRAGVFSREF